MAAIRSLVQGKPWFSPSFLKQMIESETTQLTDEELTLLRLLVAGKTDRQMARRMNLSQRTIRRRINKICEKLGTETRIETVYQVGLRRLLDV